MKIIQVECCDECPYKRDDDGGGFVTPFDICDKFQIILDEKFENKWINTRKEIHPECKLEDIII